MKWSPEQDNALLSVKKWLQDKDSQVFRLFGYAGTGKTTLAKELAEGVGGEVLFGAFTGKAAYVLQQKGCDGARTIHSLIYNSRDKSKKQLRDLEEQLDALTQELSASGMPETEIKKHARVIDISNMLRIEQDNIGRPFFALNPDSDVKHAALVIIDECSMVDKQMGEDLLSFGVKVLVLGDPAQLPPIGGAGFFTEDVTPDIMLSEIHRQAAESPIIELATMIRKHKLPSLGQYGKCKWISAQEVEQSEVLAADQIRVGKNKTRFAMNHRVRKLLDRIGEENLESLGQGNKLPTVEDKLVCLRNNHDEGLLNGALFRVHQIVSAMDDKILMQILNEDGDLKEVLSHAQYFLGTQESLKWFEKKDAQEFDYGYALTVHKSQGSQWDNVYLFDESNSFRKDKWRWLYTGITRAAEQITIVRM